MKEKIKNRFNIASDTYENIANIQKDCAHILVSNLDRNFPDYKPNSILDLGTGTGYVAEELLRFWHC